MFQKRDDSKNEMFQKFFFENKLFQKCDASKSEIFQKLEVQKMK